MHRWSPPPRGCRNHESGGGLAVRWIRPRFTDSHSRYGELLKRDTSIVIAAGTHPVACLQVFLRRDLPEIPCDWELGCTTRSGSESPGSSEASERLFVQHPLGPVRRSAPRSKGVVIRERMVARRAVCLRRPGGSRMQEAALSDLLCIKLRQWTYYKNRP
jgi:hypothetical protein